MRRFLFHLLLVSGLALWTSLPVQAATPRQQQEGPQKQAPPDQSHSDSKQQSANPSDNSSSSSSSSSSAAAEELQQPDQGEKYDPLPAEKDVEVGTFYMRKGDYDAAIPRFEDAIQRKADYAKPRLLLAQSYEKKGDRPAAVKYYKAYLEVYPHAPDAKKVQEKIEKLSAH